MPVQRLAGRLSAHAAAHLTGLMFSLRMALWMAQLLALLLAVLLAVLLALTSPRALAAEPARIEAFDVERIASLQPGSRLNFTVFGSPGAQVQLDIEGARQALPMRETEAGIYEAVYVVDAMDRIGAGSRVIATLRSADRSSVRAVLEEPLLLDAAAEVAQRGWPANTPPTTPPVMAGTVPLATPPAAPPIGPVVVPPATSTNPPVYSPSTGPASPSATPPPEQAPVQQARRPPQPWPAAPPEATAVPPGCRQCAIVESIRSVETPPQRPPHSVAGNVLGALFGENVAEKVDRHVDRVNTAIDRAVKGRSQTPLPNTRYEVLLRLPDGRRLTRLYDAPPPFRAGDMLVLPEHTLRGGGSGGGSAGGGSSDSLAQGAW